MKTISYKNAPPRLPFGTSLLWITGLSYWNAPQWLWGIIVFVLAFAWVAKIHKTLTCEPIDIFEDKK